MLEDVVLERDGAGLVLLDLRAGLLVEVVELGGLDGEVRARGRGKTGQRAQTLLLYELLALLATADL